MSSKENNQQDPGKNTPPADDQKLKNYTESQLLTRRMDEIQNKIMVLSGKGGVGKSTVAANIAVTLAMEGKKVGLLDTDFHGPSIPTLLNLDGKRPSSDGTSIYPIEYLEGVKVMSIGFLVPNRDDAVIWRGPMKMNVIKQLLSDVNWGKLDYLIVDFPPGTGDEPLSVAQLIPQSNGAVIVTTPQDLSLNDVRKCISFCRQVNIPILGVIENMSGLVCPNCHHLIDVFKSGGGQKMAEEMGVPFLGTIPIDPNIVEASDKGMPFVYHYSDSEAATAFRNAVQPLLDLESRTGSDMPAPREEDTPGNATRIAIPVVQGRLSPHFGHCDEFAIFDVDLEKKEILSEKALEAPPHEPGLLPRWLGENNVNIIIAGGMGSRARDLFAEQGISVSVGAPSDTPANIIQTFMEGTLVLGDNVCDH
ncbi:MAG: P-loop NTPase [Syntrophales bacterium]|jgi:Mrp family chromosome partitioning ATPase/predicted Fe-Mo cluster-binding NifX family protein|nr:P-loop NTPase [Syntrophales bacterium]MDY0043688.1 iron-sulfur cluster carrier protein MrpORP [Syntrophales bacterium]